MYGNLYFELLKKTLTGLIYEDECYLSKKFDYDQRVIGKDWPLKAYTMVGLKRLDNLQECMENVIHDQVPGDSIECGVWRGGTGILMQAIWKYYEEDRNVWLADSFKGFPGNPKKNLNLKKYNVYLSVSAEEVKCNFIKYGFLDDHVKFIEGWFRNTLNKVPIEKLSILRCDADLYSSVSNVLRELYPKLSKGGYLIIDDYYSVSGCRVAVNRYRKQNNVQDRMMRIDWSGMYWKKMV